MSTPPNLEKILAATLTATPVEQLRVQAKDWLGIAKHPCGAAFRLALSPAEARDTA
jgi:hypothetical protein